MDYDQRSKTYLKSKVSLIEVPKSKIWSDTDSSFQCGEMAEDKEATTSSLSQGLAPQDPEDPPKSPPTSPNSSTRKVRLLLIDPVGIKIWRLLSLLGKMI